MSCRAHHVPTKHQLAGDRENRTLLVDGRHPYRTYMLEWSEVHWTGDKMIGAKGQVLCSEKTVRDLVDRL